MAGYLGASPVPQTIQKKQSFTATASQTTFNTTGYTDGQFINVYLNGVRLINGTDYTATNGSDIVLTTGASASDVLDFETFNEFTLIDQTLETPTFRTSATLKNDTEEDTDGGRESTLIFKGEQSGGEISTLAEIEASHDGASDDQKGDLIFRTNDGSDGTSPTEAARIDSSQNLLVGKTSQDSATAGGEILASGTVIGTRDGSTAGRFNRKTSDGDIVDFRKDNTTVGSIGVASSNNIYIGATAANHAGVYFGTNIVYPMTAGSISDASVNLGEPTAGRFQDLYLSGGAYLGGTAAANYLDDYEEGTWTPTAVDGVTGFSIQRASYTKVGRLVYINAYLSAITGKNSDALRIGGLPFTADTDVYSGGIMDTASTGDVGYARTSSGSSTLGVFSWDASTVHRNHMLGNEVGSQLIFSLSYEV